MNVNMKIGKRNIGEKHPVFIIAELSANHGQKYELAVETIKAMKKAGADAVKLQTYTPDTMTIDCDNKYFKITQGTVWDNKNFYDLYKDAYTPWEWHPKLKKLANELGLEFFSSPFDKSAVDFLDKLDAPAYKVASFEITDIPLIEYIAKKGKPVIFATGIAELADIKLAVQTCRKVGNNQIVILKCTSAYPAKIEEMNLRMIPDLQKRFKTIIGLSDHAMNNIVPITATALGAKVIEKHFILDRKMGGPDAGFSMEPLEFKQMVQAIRDTEQSLGTVNYQLSPKMKKSREFSRSLFVVKDIEPGEKISLENIRSIRPGFGLAPKYLPKILGKKVNCQLKRGTPFSLKYLNK